MSEIYINEFDSSRYYDRDIGHINPQAYNAEITFTSSAVNVDVRLKGIGEIWVSDNGLVYTPVTLNSRNVSTVHYEYNTDNIRTFYLLGEGIEDLDLHGNGIETFRVNRKTTVKTLRLYDNNINFLDVSNLYNLQFLHIHNNPICDKDEYLKNLKICISKLPNRSARSVGSIVFYPWYGLETLIYKEADGSYTKYPSHNEYSLVEGKLYGVVKDNLITYYTYVNGQLKEYTAMNRHHRIRKQLETVWDNGCLNKNWLFGSAIRYSPDDWKLCYHYFRDSGIADMWETAEKGFGMCIGSIDQFSGRALGWTDMNVKAYQDLEGNERQPYDESCLNWANYTKGSWSHGDFILSQIVGRGDGVVYGIAPNAQIYLVDFFPTPSNYHQLWQQSIERITQNCTSYTSSYNVSSGVDSEYWQRTRLALGKFGKNNIITVSGGNNGDGLQWTYEQQTSKSVAYGNFGTDEDVTSTENHTNTFYVGAFTPCRTQATFSNSSVDCNLINGTPLDYWCHYGDQIMGYRNYLGSIGCAQGTSMASPNCNATLTLMRVIYSKIFPQETSFGKPSNFVKYVREHWCDRIFHQMDFASGYGMPYILAEPVITKPLAVPPIIQFEDTVELYKPFKLNYLTNDNSLNTYTLDYDYRKLAVTRDNILYGLKPGVVDINVYSNSSIQSPNPYSQNYYKETVSVEVVDNGMSYNVITNGRLPVTTGIMGNYHGVILETNEQNKDTDCYTVQLPIKYTPQDVMSISTTPGTYSNSSIMYLIYNCNAGEGKVGMSGINYTVAADGTVTWNLNGTQLVHQGPSSQPTSRLAKYNRYRTATGELGVLTMKVNPDGVDYYYNGTHLMFVDTLDDNPILLRNIIILLKPLCHDSPDCVYMYDRELTDDEIIQNTIAIINTEENR